MTGKAMTDADNGRSKTGEKLRFFGKVTASVSHEINNVFAIIGEHAGLAEDLLLTVSEERPLSPEKIGNVVRTIKKHLDRGKTIVKRLNNFSHSVDQPVASFNAGEAAENIVNLAGRLAYQKKAELLAQLPPDEVMIETDPFAFRHAIFLAVMLMLEKSGSGDGLCVAIQAADGGVEARVSSTAAGETDSGGEQFHALCFIMEEMGGRASVENAQGPIVLAFPARSPGH